MLVQPQLLSKGFLIEDPVTRNIGGVTVSYNAD